MVKAPVKKSEERRESKRDTKVHLKTHKNIQENYSYKILSLEENFARISADFQQNQTISEQGLVFDGSIFLAANFAVIAAINELDTIVVDSKAKFYSPVKKGDTLILEASTKASNSNKKEVSVIGLINDITVFQADFTTIKLDNKSLVR